MSTMKAWQYTAANGALEKSLFLEESLAKPARVFDTEILVEVVSMSLNPADYKVPELGMVSKAVFKTPATPGMDFSGRVAMIGSKVDWFAVGESVFGRLEATQHGTLGQFIVVRQSDTCVAKPNEVGFDQAAALGTAGLTAYQAIAPNVKPGDKVLINGGAGGTGTFGIQIAKLLGCHVTTTCSEAKAALCKSLGADETIDYQTHNIVQDLSEGGSTFNLIIDNVGSPLELYKASDNFLLPSGKFVQVGSSMSWENIKSLSSRLLLPSFLGGGQRKFEFFLTKSHKEDMQQLGTWMAEGKIRAVIDETFDFEDAREALTKLKSGRATGKIVIYVGKR